MDGIRLRTKDVGFDRHVLKAAAGGTSSPLDALLGLTA